MQTSKYIWTTRILLVITFIFIFASLVIGLIRDTTGEACSGIMGAQISCVEEQSFYSVIFGVPIIILLVAILTMDYMSKNTRVIKNKKLKPKLKKN